MAVSAAQSFEEWNRRYGDAPSPAELLFLTDAHRRYALFGFPPPAEVKIKNRSIDGSVVRSSLASHPPISVVDGYTPLCQLLFDQNRKLAMVELHFDGGQCSHILQFLAGHKLWNGFATEPWTVSDD